MKLKEELGPLLEGEIYDDEKSLDEASRDASLFEIQPALVVAPKNKADIAQLVRYATRHLEEKISLTARSAGTDMSGGPLSSSIVLDMKPHFNHILEVNDDYAVTEPGVYYRDFEKATLKQNRLMPAFPASRELCTVGGMVANNAGGEKTPAYGKTEDYVAELQVVFSDGQEYTIKPLSQAQLEKKMGEETFEGKVYKKLFRLISENQELIQSAKPKVSKNSSGYFLWNVWDGQTFDLNKLLVGSQGTLGLITRIKFRLIEPKKHSRLLIILLENVNSLGEITKKIMAHHPASFESYDDNTLKLAIRYFPELVRLMRDKNLFATMFDFLPEALMVAEMRALPKLVLMAEFIGDDNQEVDEKVRQAEESIASYKLKTRVTEKDDESIKYWVIRRESFNLLRHHIRDRHTAPFIDDIVVNPEKLPDFLPELEKIMGQYKLIYTIAGHVGDGNFHIIPLMNLADPETKRIIPKLSREVYDLVFQYEGSMSGEHNDGLIRTPFLLDMYGPQVYKLFEETKEIFDPHNIFNPGKKVHGKMSYALKHFIQDEHAS